MVDWPTDLPCALMNSFTESPPENNIRTTMDTGVAKVRRRSTAASRPITFSLSLTNSQVDILDNFYLSDTYSGTLVFNFIHPRTNALVEARFVEKPQYRSASGKYNAAVNLEILP